MCQIQTKCGAASMSTDFGLYITGARSLDMMAEQFET